MAVKALELYQGEDWTTYRPTVAEAFDSLDRLRQLCDDGTVEVGTFPTPLDDKKTDDAQENARMVVGALLALCDDLDGQIVAVLAELSSHMRHDAPQRWLGVELQMHLSAMRSLAQEQPLMVAAIPAIMGKVAEITERIVFILKTLDQ